MQLKTDVALTKNRDSETKKISKFWNKLSKPWQDLWGNHIHHGYYENSDINPQIAQEILLEKLINLLNIADADTILDVGCGLGGTSIYLAKKFNVNVTGIAISEKQIELANFSAQKANLNNTFFIVQDALEMKDFAKEQFDLVWSLESCEQFFDKNSFLKEAYRILRPGGQLLLATWCASADEYVAEQAARYVNLCKAFDLPYMPSISFYEKAIIKNNFNLTQSLDWTKQVAQSWDDGMDRVKHLSPLQMLKLGGIRGFRFIKQLKLMRQAFQKDEIRYAVFVAEKNKAMQCRSHTMTS